MFCISRYDITDVQCIFRQGVQNICRSKVWNLTQFLSADEVIHLLSLSLIHIQMCIRDRYRSMYNKSYFYHVSLTTGIENNVINLENSVQNNCRNLQSYIKEFTSENYAGEHYTTRPVVRQAAVSSPSRTGQADVPSSRL